MEKKPITTIEFMKKYNELTSSELKEKLIKALIYREYVPVLEKKLILQTMFDKSIIGNDSNRYVDMFISKINTTIAILEMYTNLSFKKTEEDTNNMFDDYDLLMEQDLINEILNNVPKNEINTIISINEQILDTFYNSTKSTAAYVSGIVDRFAKVFGEMTDSSSKALLETLNDDKKMNKFMSKLSNSDVAKKVKEIMK